MSASMKTCLRSKRYILQFANDHLDFRNAEMKAICEIFGFTMKIESQATGSPFMVVELPSDKEAKQLMSRTVLVRSLYELWGIGSTYVDLYKQVQGLPSEVKAPCFASDKTFRISVETYNKKIGYKDKLKIIESLPGDIFCFKGKVDLNKPDIEFGLMEFYGPHNSEPPDDPYMIYFGRKISDGQRDLIQQYCLTKRHFIGNTSMEPGLSFLMSNLGQVKQSSLVIDPFVGTGSLLVACAKHGGYVMGTDLDYLLLHAKARPSRHNQTKRQADESIHSNLQQYGLGHCYLDVLVADSSKHKMWRSQPLFDAIITDPPYGIREGAKRIGTEKDEIILEDSVKNGHIPQRVEYQMADIFLDLLNFAAKFLTIKGRLVFWFPVSRQSYQEENLPTHPCLTLESNCEQVMSTRISRRLITMVKHSHFLDKDNSSAKIKVDHYDNKPFRDLYYRKSEKTDLRNQNHIDSIGDKLQATKLDET